MNFNRMISTSALFLSASLAGCGGGSGGDSPPAPAETASNAQGLYEGSVSNGLEHKTLILENDQIYAIYGNTVNGVFHAMGFIQGNGKSNNGSFSAANIKNFNANGSVTSGSLSATYSLNISFSGTLAEGSTTTTFTGTTLKNLSYNYTAAANPSNIVGTWNLTDLQSTPVFLTISPDKTLTGSSGGCSFSGTIAPRTSGKNVFDIALTFGPAPCRLPGQSAIGIALEHPLGNGKHQLIIAGTNTSRTSGTVLFGSR